MAEVIVYYPERNGERDPAYIEGGIVGNLIRCKECRYGQRCTTGKTCYQCFKWNSNEFGAHHEPDWFCADGERKN